MYYLPDKNKRILTKNIKRHKQLCFSGRGSGLRFAEEMGVAPQTISNWLSGSRLPTLKQLYRLSKVFAVSPLELCGIKTSAVHSRKTAHIALLHALLAFQIKSLEHNVNPHIIIKLLNEVKDIITIELNDS